MAPRESVDEGAGDPDAEQAPVWIYGINSHIQCPSELPSSFKPSGILRADYAQLCTTVAGAVPHPSFKMRPLALTRRPSIVAAMQQGGKAAAAEAAAAKTETPDEDPILSVRLWLMDQFSIHAISLLLPVASRIQVLCFSGCRLDVEMLQLLRKGLLGEKCAVESLQIEWNPLELALPTPEEMETLAQAQEANGSSPRVEIQTPKVSARTDGQGSNDAGYANLEARERRRYQLQSNRALRSFREWLKDHRGGLENAWATLAASNDTTIALTYDKFLQTLEEVLGMNGPPVTEVFEVLDGPDYAGSEGRISLDALRQAIEALPEEPTEGDANDPVGLVLAGFVDGHCVVESLSLRSCGIGTLELVPLADALSRCPWHLRILNLWENRVSDHGAELLARALEEYRGLEYLGLGHNRITDAGLVLLCRPFESQLLDEAGLLAAREKIKQQTAHHDAVMKEKAKAKGKPSGLRVHREDPFRVDELEERPPAPGDGEGALPTWVLRRPCDLKAITLSDNPIKSTETLETLQPRGPAGAELLLRGTPAAAVAVARGKPNLSNRGPAGTGWVMRLV